LQVLPRDTNFAFNLSHVKFIKKERNCLISNQETNIMDMIICNLGTIEAAKLS